MLGEMFPGIFNIDDAIVEIADNNSQNTKYSSFLMSLNNLIKSDKKVRAFLDSVKNQRKFTEFVNIIQVANKRNDSLAYVKLDSNSLLDYLSSDFDDLYEALGTDEVSIEDELRDNYLDPKLYGYGFLNIDNDASDDEISEVVNKNQEAQISSSHCVSATEEAVNTIDSLLEGFGKDKPEASHSNEDDTMIDPDYWVRAVSIETPFMPNCDVHNIIYKTRRGDTEYRVYGEAVKPWNQSMIGLATDVNKFSDSEVLSLFPEIRIYLRGNELYHPVEGLDFDDDLGVIFHIKGVTKKQMIKNIIEYPHIFQFDRWVRKQGTLTTIPFWKHIELNGEMRSTTSVWGTKELPDTKKIPKTTLFMNEYVMRKYIIEENKGIDHKYKMRGEIWPFLTLYAPPEYYEEHGYDPLEVGRACIRARQHLCYTRNPIINMHKERLVDSKS